MDAREMSTQQPEPPVPQVVPVRPMARLGHAGVWTTEIVAKIEAAYGPITPHPDPEKARLLAECAWRVAKDSAAEPESPPGSLIADAVLREEPPPPRSLSEPENACTAAPTEAPHYHSWFCGCPDAIQRLEEATEPEPAPVVQLAPAPPSRRGWFGHIFRRPA